MSRILVINGPNMNMLGIREPGIYGSESYEMLLIKIRAKADELGCAVEFFQSNSEGAIIDAIQAAYGEFDGIVINPAAYTHYSYAIHDAIKSVGIPTIEVHISDIHSREDFRHDSVVLPACIGQVAGLGFDSYTVALERLINETN